MRMETRILFICISLFVNEFVLILCILVNAQVFLHRGEMEIKKTTLFTIPKLHQGYYISYEYNRSAVLKEWYAIIGISDIAFAYTDEGKYKYKIARNAPEVIEDQPNPIGEWRRNVIYMQRFGGAYIGGFIVDGKSLTTTRLNQSMGVAGVNILLNIGGGSEVPSLSGAIRDISIFGMVNIID